MSTERSGPQPCPPGYSRVADEHVTVRAPQPIGSLAERTRGRAGPRHELLRLHSAEYRFDCRSGTLSEISSSDIAAAAEPPISHSPPTARRLHYRALPPWCWARSDPADSMAQKPPYGEMHESNRS